ncbi:MAG: PhzF family phenazine biosynthesis protein [Stellaceae bacterium]
MQYEFVTVDVFTDRRFGGNPLAVFPNAAGLTTEQMQAIANEFNLSETTFVLPPKDPAHTAQVRIFTPKFEMPFAGHPNVGTGFVVAGRLGVPGPLVFEEIAGFVPIEVLREGGTIVGARLTAPQPLSRGAEVAVDIIASACSLLPGDIETRHHTPCDAGCGTRFMFAEVKTREALARATPRADIFAQSFTPEGTTGVHLYFRDGAEGVDIRTRMFAPLHGVPEDPATGSANVALAGLLASLRPERDLSLNLRTVQGVEMGRPSLLEASAEKRAGVVAETRIGGRCIPVLAGTIEV